MIKSNKSVGSSMFSTTSSFSAKSVMQDLSTIENSNIRRQVGNQQRAIMMGKAQEALNSAKTLSLASRASHKSIKPLVRKRTARDFANAD
jgi:hypothetical protein